jgi:hypothetical protein
MAKSSQAGAQANQAADAGTAAAYLPFKTFLSAIESLEHGIPKKIDRTIWRTQAYVVQSQIIMAFRFLKLLDNGDNPTPALQELVDSRQEARKIVLDKLLVDAYRNIVDLDLTKTTPKMLDDAMEQYSVSGDTKKKAVRFFLQAAKYVDMPMHPLLQGQIRNTGPRKKRTPKPTFIGEMNTAADPAYDPDARPTSSQTAPLSNGGRIVLQVFGDPFALPSEERTLMFELVDKLRDHAASHSADGGDYESEEEEERT